MATSPLHVTWKLARSSAEAKDAARHSTSTAPENILFFLEPGRGCKIRHPNRSRSTRTVREELPHKSFSLYKVEINIELGNTPEY